MTNEKLVYLYQNGDKDALNELIKGNKKIVYKISNKFYVRGINSVDKEDLEQEGFIGIIIAANKYDFDNAKNAKFITYAIHWIYQRMSRYINQRDTNDEISLNVPFGEDSQNELMDTIQDGNNCFENVEEKIYNQQLREELEWVMFAHNTIQERQVLKFRHGWNDGKPMTLAEIGDIFNVTGPRIRDIESAAYRKLRRTPWGRAKYKELYAEKLISRRNTISGSINFMDFKQRYDNENKKASSFLNKYI